MIAAIIVAAVVLSLALWEAAEKLAAALREATNGATERVCDAIGEAAKGTDLSYRSRMIPAEVGTQLAYVLETDNGVEIDYAPVLAFVEGEGGEIWSPLAFLKGDLQAHVYSASIYSTSKVASARVLLPGESLSDEECAEIKKQYAEWVELDKELAAKRTLSGVPEYP